MIEIDRPPTAQFVAKLCSVLGRFAPLCAVLRRFAPFYVVRGQSFFVLPFSSVYIFFGGDGQFQSANFPPSFTFSGFFL